MLKKKVTLNRTSRNQKVDSREGDVIKEVYPLEQGRAQKNKPTYVMYVGKLCCVYHLHFYPTVPSMLFSLILSQKMFMKLLQIQIGFQQCKKSFTSSREIRYDTWYQSPRTEQSQVLSGCSETSQMSKEQSLGTRHDQLFSVTIMKKALIMKRPLLRLQELRLLEF